MKSLTNRARRGTATLALMTAGMAFAASASAGDCSMSKAKKKAQYTATPATQVLGSATHSNVSYAGHQSMNSATIVDAAVATGSLSTLVAAVTAADLVDTLASPGPFTVFAPVNSAFAALPAGTVDTLLMPQNKQQLQKVLTAHVVAGSLSAQDIVGLAKSNGGSVDVQTVSGDTLTAILSAGMLYVKDESGGIATVKTADIMKSNGTVHVVDKVLLPR